MVNFRKIRNYVIGGLAGLAMSGLVGCSGQSDAKEKSSSGSDIVVTGKPMSVVSYQGGRACEDRISVVIDSNGKKYTFFNHGMEGLQADWNGEKIRQNYCLYLNTHTLVQAEIADGDNGQVIVKGKKDGACNEDEYKLASITVEGKTKTFIE